MNRIKTYLNSLGRATRAVLLGLAVIFVSAGIAQAATTITTDISTGNITASGTLGVTGAISTQSTLTVGAAGSAVSRIVKGYCVTASVAIPATNASSTQTYTNCTPSGGTSIITSGDIVFLQATSSLPYYVVIQSASSTASGGLINVRLTNFSTTTSVTAAIYSFNFWAFQ